MTDFVVTSGGLVRGYRDSILTRFHGKRTLEGTEKREAEEKKKGGRIFREKRDHVKMA